MSKPILISGIQPTGRLHLGNYLGALKNFVELQNSGKYQCFFFVADLHALTENPTPEDLSKNIASLAADFITAGLNPKKSVIFVQSRILETDRFAWIFNTIAPIGELERMTQYKDKAASVLHGETVNTGLLTYPLLMTADILLYNAKFVPVGKDQIQHLELARTLARKFNNKFGATFTEPQPILTEISKVMSLKDPNKKMSKSQPDGCLFLDDSPQEIDRKIKSAITDSESEVKYSPKNKAGISNLMDIYSALSEMPVSAIEEKYKGKGYGDFKKDLIKIIVNALEPFRKTKTPNAKLKTILNAGAKKAQKIASVKMEEVKEKLGLYL